MKTILMLVLSCWLLGAGIPVAAADIYVYTDKNGTITFTDSTPPENAEKIVSDAGGSSGREENTRPETNSTKKIIPAANQVSETGDDSDETVPENPPDVSISCYTCIPHGYIPDTEPCVRYRYRTDRFYRGGADRHRSVGNHGIRGYNRREACRDRNRIGFRESDRSFSGFTIRPDRVYPHSRSSAGIPLHIRSGH